jgi:glycosyltransferase involved in cell wall biosynthesis
MQDNKISFIIPAYNCESTIKEAVESIFDKNFEDGDEIIIINDGSTDNTMEVLTRLKNKYPQVIVLHHNYNKGSAAAGRNTGIDFSKNELIFCLDSDNILETDSIKKLKKFLYAENADSVAFGEIHYFVDNKENVTHKWVLNRNISFIDNINDTHKTPCSSGNYLFTKNSWLKAGRYNESIGGAYDSWAFGCAQLATGSKIMTLPDSFYYHRYGYNSTYNIQVGMRNVSLTITQILIPFIDLIDKEDINYILDRENRKKWFDKTKIRPLKMNSEKTETEVVQHFSFKKDKIKKIVKKTLKMIGLLKYIDYYRTGRKIPVDSKKM